MLLGNEAAVDAYLAEISAGEDVAEKMIAEKKQALGVEFYPILRRMVLQAIDFFWVEHLETMDHLRGSVNLRAYGQRDPLVEYRTEGMRLFKGMQSSINEHILSVLQGIGAEAVAAPSALSSVNIINNTPKTGRNDPCPCGSGKKFKKCHGAV